MVSEHIPESIAERYQIKSVLGKGGMGMVLHAFDPFLGIDVAIKYMRSDDSGRTAARMQREAIAAGKLKHANIARVYDFGKTPQDEPYMVMELLQGKSLAERMQELRPELIEPKEAVSIFIQICDGLHAAHAASIIHRDLKPDNVFVLEDGNVKLVDFGIAQLNTTDSRERGFEGSPLYMSPEQAKSEETDTRSDIYSFGCLMYEVLSGKPPFVGASALETVSMQINSKAPSLRQAVSNDLPNELPDELIDLIQRCLEKDPLKRPQNCDEISNVLESALSILKKRDVVVAAPVASAKEISIRKEENLLKLMACMAILLVITTAGGFYIVLTEKKPTTTRVLKESGKIDLTQEPEQMIWPKQEVSAASVKNKFEFNEDKGIYMVRQRFAVTDQDFKFLKGYNRLRYLLFDFAQFDGSGLAYIADLPVTRFENNFGSIKDENMKYLGQMKHLDHLSLSSPFLSDNGLKQLLPLKKLVALGIGSDKITDQSIPTIAHFQNLDTLTLWAPLMSDAIVPALYKMKNLKTLYLMKMKLSSDIGIKLARLKHLKNIGFLEIEGLSDESLKALCGLKLDWIDFGDTKLGDNQLAFLPENLGGIGLTKTKVSAKNLENLKRIKLLKKLNLSANPISDAHIKIVSRLKLEELSLVKTDLSFKQLLMLSNIETLKKLNIQDTNITPDQLAEFQREFNLKHRRDCEVKVGAIEDEIIERIHGH
ncbi:MAG: protein kinase [Cyanobacteria bacterium TGS_CYA1]|nr:protein kinase [Cyanobacteria bacterium TGS_CYA1]